MNLPVNSPCVLTGIVKSIKAMPPKDGKSAYVVLIEYLVERGRDQTVEASREFWVSAYYETTCKQITQGAKVAIEFNAGSREYNGKLYAKDDVRTIKVLEHGPPAPPEANPASDGLNYRNAAPVVEEDPLF